jgi:mono/diheme cytochrome c family protein
MSRLPALPILIVTLALAAAQTPAAQPATRLALQLEDYVQMPITGELDGQNTRGLLARVNFLRDEPGGRRFFVNDLNGPLYILDKQQKTFTTYIDLNGAGGRPGLFEKFTFERNFATGLINFEFDPDYRRNGVFYTLHMEDATLTAAAAPRPGAIAGLDLAGYTTTPAIPVHAGTGKIEREVILIEWKDRNPADSKFEGAARELLRLQHPSPIHPLGEMTFNPVARRGDADWRVMYVGVGDAGTGEQKDSRRLNPQRLDTLGGKILRIIPDLREHTSTSTVSGNGRYRIPDDNPFSTVEGACKEIWASGIRNPHRLVWDIDPARPREPLLMSPAGMGPIPQDDTIPVQISDTVARGTVKPTYPVIEYPHMAPNGGDAIAGGFIYRGKKVPALRGKLIFGDITTGRIWSAERADVVAADDGSPATVAQVQELEVGLRRIVEETYRERGGKGEALPGAAGVSGRGRVDLRFAVDHEGELYILTKSDGMIRKVVGARPSSLTAPTPTPAVPAPRATSTASSVNAATLTNPVASTPESMATGKKSYDANCAACHGNLAQGAVKAGVAISIIEEQKGKQPPDLTDAEWDHGSTDGEIYTAIKRGIPPTMMAGWEGRIPDDEIWAIVNYLRSLAR